MLVSLSNGRFYMVRYLLAEMPDAPDLKGAGGLRILHLQVHVGPHMFGHADTLQQGRVDMEVVRHGGVSSTSA